jgi:hypothetical protein
MISSKAPIIEKLLSSTEVYDAIEDTIGDDPVKYRTAYYRLLGHEKAVRAKFRGVLQKLELIRLDICEFEDKEHVLQVIDSLTNEVRGLT